MLRPMPSSALALVGLLALAPFGARAQEVLTPEEEALKRLGFYFALSLESTSQRGMANGLGVVVDEPSLGGFFDVDGPEVDGEFQDRLSFGFKLGFRLRNGNGNIEANYWHFDEQQDLLRLAPEGKKIANSLASSNAGFAEDVGRAFISGGPDGSVAGYEAGRLSEGTELNDRVSDGAEDWNFNGSNDFIRFATSDRIVGALETDLKQFDVDYVRALKRLRRFQLDWRAGLRVSRLAQTTDLAYRELDSFAVYSDIEGPESLPLRPCSDPGSFPGYQDGDGDDQDSPGPGNDEPDGDGFMDGDCDTFMFDEIESVATISEDRIVARIDTEGIGLRLGLDGHFQLTKKWSVSGQVALNLMSTDVEYRYIETFTSERDAYLNFIDWDFNGDGVYDNRDLDFDGSCANLPPEACRPNSADSALIRTMGGLGVAMRAGAGDSVVDNPGGLIWDNAYDGQNFGLLRQGDAVGESERNRDVVREVTVLNDIAGSDSGIQPQLDLTVGAEWQFSRFARLDFGVRTTRWFGAGSFRSLANDVLVGRDLDVLEGDFTTDGAYLRITVVPR